MKETEKKMTHFGTAVTFWKVNGKCNHFSLNTQGLRLIPISSFLLKSERMGFVFDKTQSSQDPKNFLVYMMNTDEI